jgi:uncharacterized protein (TIGR04255 family)
MVTRSEPRLGTYREFSNPPVVETALGVQFKPLAGWAAPHFGLFWETIRDRFPKFEDQLPLPPQVETYERPGPRVPQLEFLIRPVTRCWFYAANQELVLQVQNGRFIQNWRKERKGKSYPKYESTRESFRQDWDRFVRFLQDQGFGNPVVEQCEISYVNHLYSGTGWNSLADIGNVFPALSGLSRVELPSPESFVLDVKYVLPEKRGRLHVQIQPALRNTDGKELLQFNLIVRGAPVSSNTSDILEWFDFGRAWIHKAFDEYPSDSIRAHWDEGE